MRANNVKERLLTELYDAESDKTSNRPSCSHITSTNSRDEILKSQQVAPFTSKNQQAASILSYF